MDEIRPLLEQLTPVVGAAQHLTTLGEPTALKIKVLLEAKAHAQPGGPQLGQIGQFFGSDPLDWLEVGRALVCAKRQSDMDILLQRQSVGLGVIKECPWPDVDGDDSPVLAMLDDQPPLPALTAAVQAGECLLVGSDGSVLKTGAGLGIVFAAVQGESSEWQNQDEDTLRVVAKVAYPYPVKAGRLATTSFDVELHGLVVSLRALGRVALPRTHAIFDALTP
jgi:hypothetical protein